MSQKNFIKICKVCDVVNRGIDSSRRIFFICWNFTHTIRLRRGTAMGAAFNIVLFELLAGIFLCITGRLRAAYRSRRRGAGIWAC